MLKHVLIAAVSLLAIDESRVQAHNFPISEMMLVADEEYLHMEIVLNATELTFFRELDRDQNGHLNFTEVADRGEQVSRRVVDCFEIRVNGQVVEADIVGLVPNYNSHHLTIRAHYLVDATEASVEITSHLAAITHGAHLVQLVYRTPHENHRVRLNATAASVLFPAPAAGRSTRLETLTTKTAANSWGSPSWWERFGVAIGLSFLLGSLFLFCKKNR